MVSSLDDSLHGFYSSFTIHFMGLFEFKTYIIK